MIRFEKTSARNIKVTRDGAFIGWLEKSSHKPTGLCAKRYTLFSGIVGGRDVHANTLTKARQIIEKGAA